MTGFGQKKIIFLFIFIFQIVTKSNNKIRKLLRTHVFYIVPVFNPDGYVYSFEEDRLWRKTRRPTLDPSCIGVDPNRNWNVKWGGKKRAVLVFFTSINKF